MHFVAPLVIVLGGCAEEKELEPICDWVDGPGECEDPGGETGGAAEDEEPTDPAPCTLSADGHTRTVYQCAGGFSASLAFNTLLGDCGQTLGDPGWCDEVHEFGPLADPYEVPAVMACCDAEEPVDEDELLKYCRADMVEQICRSVPTRLQNLIDEDAFPVGENQAQELQGWLAEHQQDCYDMLHQPSDTPGELTPISWLVNGGNNGKWPSLNNFTIKIDSAKVDYAYLPEDAEDHRSCDDNDLNNTEVFEDTIPTSPGINSITHLDPSPLVWVTGPEIFGAPVSGHGSLASQASGCVAPWCSVLEITANDATGHWTLEELELFGDGPVILTNGGMSLLVDRAAIRLYQVGRGTIQVLRDGSQVHSLQPGEAHFVISGVGVFADLHWGTNASPITARETAAGWSIDPFIIEHLDDKGETWTIGVPQTTWN